MVSNIHIPGRRQKPRFPILLTGIILTGLVFLTGFGLTAFAGQNADKGGSRLTPRFKVIINNNPQFKGESIHGIPVTNVPSIRIEGRNISDNGSLRISVFGGGGEILFTGMSDVKAMNGVFSLDFPLKATLKDPLYTRVDFLTSKGRTVDEIPALLHKIYGRVSDFEGKPLEAYFLVSWDADLALRARAGRDGRYVLWVPEEKIGHIFVDDASYGKTSLESFIGHEFVVKDDIELNIHIGRMELYNMRSWATLSTFYVYFIPMSLPRLQAKAFEGKREKWPRLLKNDVRVWINGAESELQQLEEVRDYMGHGKEDWRPGYILSFGLKAILDAYRQGPVITIRVQASDSGFMSRGEAFIINPSVD